MCSGWCEVDSELITMQGTWDGGGGGRLTKAQARQSEAGGHLNVGFVQNRCRDQRGAVREL